MTDERDAQARERSRQLLRRVRWPVARRLGVHPWGDERSRLRGPGIDVQGEPGFPLQTPSPASHVLAARGTTHPGRRSRPYSRRQAFFVLHYAGGTDD